MTSSVFPDLNVWIAMTLQTHEHHAAAAAWYESLPPTTELVFCRITQLGLLRLLTTPGIAPAGTMSQVEAWAAYDTWMQNGACVYRDEPFGIEIELRAFATRTTPLPKEWGDSYLAAFAAAASLELVTFDKALSMRAYRATLLGA
jgi:hypothetical protein